MKKLSLKMVRYMYWVFAAIGVIVCVYGVWADINACKWIGIAIMVLAIVFNVKFYRCPHCGRFLGRKPGNTCPHCQKGIEA